MIGADGTLKITDFGLAVIRDEFYAEAPAQVRDNQTNPIPFDDPAPPVAVHDQAATECHPGPAHPGEPTLRLTQTGSLLGTLPYMAPEQFRDSKAVDARADIYAFGVVLFEMLTGELPFHGRTIARLDRAHSNYAPPSVVPSIPRKYAKEAESIDEIVQTCLKKEPAGRYETMDELRKALAHVQKRLDPHH